MEANLTMYLVNKAFISLKEYCEAENFKGWDPYDGLNSKIFQATPLKYLGCCPLSLDSKL